MSLLSNLIALADNLTQTFALQADVGFKVHTATDGAGARTYAAVDNRKAIFTKKNKYVRTFAGEMTVSSAQVVFLDATVVSEFDRIVDPAGVEWAILGTEAFVDASNAGVLTEIFLGPSLTM